MAAHTVTAVGNAEVDTAIKKFGTGSALIQGTADYLDVSDSAEWDFGTGDFTVDFWVYKTNGFASEALFEFGKYENTDDILFDTTSVGKLFVAVNDNIIWNKASTLPANSQWDHVAIVRSSTNLYYFLNGTIIEGPTAANFSVAPGNGPRFGDSVYNGDRSAEVQLDEIRVSNTARWTSNFSVPTVAYTADANTLLLIHCDGTDGSTTFTDDDYAATTTTTSSTTSTTSTSTSTSTSTTVTSTSSTTTTVTSTTTSTSSSTSTSTSTTSSTSSTTSSTTSAPPYIIPILEMKAFNPILEMTR